MKEAPKPSTLGGLSSLLTSLMGIERGVFAAMMNGQLVASVDLTLGVPIQLEKVTATITLEDGSTIALSNRQFRASECDEKNRVFTIAGKNEGDLAITMIFSHISSYTWPRRDAPANAT
jgi:hypothetical protein